MAEAELLEYVKGLGDIYSVSAPFDAQHYALRDVGIKTPISVRDASFARLHGNDQGYTRTCHGVIWAKDLPTIVARVSPLVDDHNLLPHL